METPVRTGSGRCVARARLTAAALALAVLEAATPAHAAADSRGEAGGATAAAPVEVTARVEPAVATVGDRLNLAITVDSASGVAVSFPDVAADVAPFEVLDALLSEPTTGPERTVERRDYVIAAFETGDLWLPSLEFEYVTAEGETGVVFGDSLLVSIESVLPEVREDEQVGPRDIKPPVELPRRVWPFIVAVLVLVAVAAAAYFLRRWLMSRVSEAVEDVVEEPPVPRVAAHLVAFERLDALEREDPIGHGDVPRFYVRVTEIVRLYLRDRFGVDAIDMTTSELPPAMREARIGEAEIEWSGRFLAHADLAKFAGHVPSDERARSDLSEAREFVERTRLRGEDVEVGSSEGGAPGGNVGAPDCEDSDVHGGAAAAARDAGRDRDATDDAAAKGDGNGEVAP
jgi:hypothetical protein